MPIEEFKELTQKSENRYHQHDFIADSRQRELCGAQHVWIFCLKSKTLRECLSTTAKFKRPITFIVANYLFIQQFLDESHRTDFDFDFVYDISSIVRDFQTSCKHSDQTVSLCRRVELK